jgi:hypothetical protein
MGVMLIKKNSTPKDKKEPKRDRSKRNYTLSKTKKKHAVYS